MRTEIDPIARGPSVRLAITPRPRGGDWLEDEVRSWRRSGLDVVVSLLDDSEVAELGLEAEPEACRGAGLEFRQFPIPDRGLPSSSREFAGLVSALAADLSDGRSVGIHCRFGIGRAALVAVCVLVRLGDSPEAAWAAIEQARGRPVPDTPDQRAWAVAWSKAEQHTVESEP